MPDYRVLKNCWIDRVYCNEGATIRLSIAQSKYHLMAGRIAIPSEVVDGDLPAAEGVDSPGPIVPQAVPKQPKKRKTTISSLGGEEA